MRILIIKIGAIGDVIMSLPMLDKIPKDWEITWVAGKKVRRLLEDTKRIDRLILVDEDKFYKKNLWEISKIFGKIAFRYYNQIFIGNPDIRYRLLSLFSFARRRSVFLPKPGEFHSKEYVRCLQEGWKTAYKKTGKTENSKNTLINHNLPLLVQQKKLFRRDSSKSVFPKRVTIAPGGNIVKEKGKVLRQWPIENYVSLTKELLKKGYEVTLTGGKDDLWILPHFSGLTFNNLVGKVSVKELVAVFGNSKLVITHDSGPMHLGRYSGTNVLGLFGPTNPLEKMHVRENLDSLGDGKDYLLWGGEGLPCRPCYNGKNYSACDTNLCMQKISVKDVMRTVDEICNRS